jgi:hypothetical protein
MTDVPGLCLAIAGEGDLHQAILRARRHWNRVSACWAIDRRMTSRDCAPPPTWWPSVDPRRRGQCGWLRTSRSRRWRSATPVVATAQAACPRRSRTRSPAGCLRAASRRAGAGHPRSVASTRTTRNAWERGRARTLIRDSGWAAPPERFEAARYENAVVASVLPRSDCDRTCPLSCRWSPATTAAPSRPHSIRVLTSGLVHPRPEVSMRFEKPSSLTGVGHLSRCAASGTGTGRAPRCLLRAMAYAR